MKNKTVILVVAAVGALATNAANMASQPWVDMKMAQQATDLKAWVEQYVATHGGGGGGGSNGVSMAQVVKVATEAQEERESIRQRLQNAVSFALMEASLSGLHALSFSYEASSNDFRNVKMAERDGGGWTNVAYGCGVFTNGQNVAVLALDAHDYTCSTFTNHEEVNVFTRIAGATTNRIFVGWSPITTNDYRTARGEN